MGFLSEIIGYPLGLVMWLAYQVVNNYALSIIIFTLITRVLLIPFSIKQQKSQVSMSALNSKIEKLKKQYGNNQQKFQEAQMKLYEQEGINPMASCLPLLIQWPILLGIFDVVNRPLTHILRISSDVMDKAGEIATEIFAGESQIANRIELFILRAVKQSPELFSEFPDLQEKALAFNNKLFGFIDLGQTPSLSPEVWNAASIGLVAVALSSGVVNIIQTILSQARMKKMNPGAPKTSPLSGMNLMLYGMQIMFIWFAFTVPAGVGFYWAMSGLFMMVQSMVFNRIFTPEYVAALIEKDKAKKDKKKPKRPGMMQRYQEMMRQQMEANGSLEKETAENAESAETAEEKLSKAKQKEYERKIIAEARRRQAEKYGEEYIESDD